MTDRHSSGAPWRNFHGRIRGKTLRPRQVEMLREDLAALSPGPVGWDENPERRPIDPSARFSGAREVWLEIGFGGGEHLAAMAARYPEVALIGAEPFLNGVAMALARLREAAVENVAIHPGDARDLFDVLPDGSIAKVFLNYPDPWPKQRHHKRRFVTPGHLGPLIRVLVPGAEFRIATDIPSYVKQALTEVPAAGFVRVEHPTDRAWPDWPSTRYEAKALREGRQPHYLTFRKP